MHIHYVRLFGFNTKKQRSLLIGREEGNVEKMRTKEHGNNGMDKYLLVYMFFFNLKFKIKDKIIL